MLYFDDVGQVTSLKGRIRYACLCRNLKIGSMCEELQRHPFPKHALYLSSTVGASDGKTNDSPFP